MAEVSIQQLQNEENFRRTTNIEAGVSVPEVEQTRIITTKQLTEVYLADKAPEVAQDITGRLESAKKSGVSEVKRRINEHFPGEIRTGNPESDGKVADNLIIEQTEKLGGQEQKLKRMEEYVRNMSTWGDEYVANIQDKIDSGKLTKLQLMAITDSNDGDVAAFIQRTKSAVKRAIVDATRAITYQDTQASALSLGDHGWMHLTQDLNDAITVAEGKQGNKSLDPVEKLLLGFAAAYHDIGYALPEVSDVQKNSKKGYGTIDKGHPLLSMAYLESILPTFNEIFSQQDSQALLVMVANHENPERAEMAGNKKHLAEAFAIADAGAAFGPDKTPALVTQIPPILSLLSALTYLEKNFDSQAGLAIEPQTDEYRDVLKQIQDVESQITALESNPYNLDQTTLDLQKRELMDVRDKLEARKASAYKIHLNRAREMYIKEVVTPLKKRVKDEIQTKILDGGDKIGDTYEYVPTELLKTQAAALLGSIDHFGPGSLKFLLGRMAAESQKPTVDSQGRVVYEIHAGFARQMEDAGSVEGMVEAASKLKVKLFSELAAINIKSPDGEVDLNLSDAIVNAFAKNSLDTMTQEQIAQLQKIGVTITFVSAQDPIDSYISLSSKTIVIKSYANRSISEQNKEFYGGIADQLEVGQKTIADFINTHRKK